MSQEAGPLAILKNNKLQEVPKKLRQEAEKWLVRQPPWVEAISTGLFGSFQGAFLGGMMGYMTQMTANEPGAAAANGPTAQLMKLGGPVQQARNFAVMTGVNAGMTSLLKRIRGKEDIQGSMIAAFTSGAAFSLVSTVGGGAAANPMQVATQQNPLMAAFSSGVLFALFQGGIYKLGETFVGPKSEEVEYTKVKQLLTSLGYAKYEKNLKRGLLKDNTILLWDRSSLREVGIPPGPRLIMLNHIDQYRHILKPAMPLPGPPSKALREASAY